MSFSCLIMVENSLMERIPQCHCPFTAAFRPPFGRIQSVVRPPFFILGLKKTGAHFLFSEKTNRLSVFIYAFGFPYRHC
ncbi:hypothetical protein HMPREF1548_03145 [Clostridium sp. KLE 1755]|nr:hypothetical protein HMPREF1548_03145 [Clostridium sp. KLE 1755]